ncbi:DNA polymerase III subunit beta [Cohnella sp. GCM10020058]|uniref:DNA polymerase III subunit beta n=1 Tax=Cohnella sp. GCM10020058 TaxID=3317330 RepID=UPI00362AA0DB
MPPLEQANEAVSNKQNNIPALMGILIIASKNGLKLIGSSVGLSIQRRIPEEDVTVVRLGSIVIPADKLVKIIKSFPPAEITIDVKGLEAHITCGKSKCKISCMSADEYTYNPIKPQTALSIPGATLRNLVSKTAFATKKEETNEFPILAGIRIMSDNGRLSFTGCDRNRVAKYYTDAETTSEMQIVVDSTGIEKAAKILGNAPTVDVGMERDQVSFATPDAIICATALEGNYPPVDSLLNMTPVATFWITASDLLGVVNRIEAVSEKKQNRIFIDAAPGRILMWGKGEAGRVEEVLEAGEYEGESARVCLNAKWVEEAVKTINTSELQIKIGKHVYLHEDNDEGAILQITPLLTHEEAWA